jgi:small subunit ribosomal protein S15
MMNMARMHARRKGKSSSKRPYRKKNPEWVPLSLAEIEKLAVKLANEGLSTAAIGIKLRDQYAVPDVKLATGKSISQILKANDVKFDIPEDIRNLMKKAVNLHAHLEVNSHDLHNKRSLALTEAKIRRLLRYYKKNGVMPADWKYSIKAAELQVE